MKRKILLVLVVLLMTSIFSLWAGGNQEESKIVVSYNSPNQWANWGAVLEAFTLATGIEAPSDPKNSGQTLAALEAEAKAPQAAVGYSVFTAGNLALGGNLDNWDAGVNYFKKLKDNGLILPAQTATAMVQQGEIPILIDADFNGYKLKYIDNAPVEIVIPEEGSISIPYAISLVKGAPNNENGKKLLNFVLSDEGQKLFSESYLRPIRNIDIDPEISSKMLPESDYKRVVFPDFKKMREVQEEAIARWNAEVR